MSTPEQTTFEFSDEVEVKVGADEKAEIEIVDDTPEADKGKKPAESPTDPTEDELQSYSESARKRIKHFTRGFHDERRAKEAAIREKEEALRIAQTVVEENKKLQGSLSQGQQALLEQAKKTTAQELEEARRKYKEAHESFDADAILKAQEDLMAAKTKADRVAAYRPAPPKPAIEMPQPKPQVPVDHKAEEWQSSNTWFGSDRKMTAYALSVHEDLVAQGVAPSSDEYYNAINSDMKKRFPEKFDSGNAADAPTQRTAKSNVVAAATRSTAPRKVVLTQSQVNIAKRLNVPLELYARQVANEMRK